MAAASEVSGTVLLQDVSCPAPGEGPARHLHRLAAGAQIQGCPVFALTGHDRLFAVLITDSGSRSEDCSWNRDPIERFRHRHVS